MKLNKIFLMSALALSGFVFTACSEDEEVPVGERVGSTIVTFVDEENKTLELTDTEFTISLQRADSVGSLTVPLEFVSKPDVVSVPSSVTFADGEKRVDVVCTLSDAAKPFVNYPLIITLPKEYAGSTYKADQDTYPRLEITIHKEDYKPYGVMTYYSWYFEEAWESEVYYSEYMDLYRCDIFYDDFTYYLKYKLTDEEKTLAFTDPNGVEKTDNYFGYVNPNYGDMYTRWDTSVPIEYEDGMLWFGVAYRVSAGTFGTNYDGLVIEKAE